jgi:cytochrome c peroxidase
MAASDGMTAGARAYDMLGRVSASVGRFARRQPPGFTPAAIVITAIVFVMAPIEVWRESQRDIAVSFPANPGPGELARLHARYARPVEEWPAPVLFRDADFTEFASLDILTRPTEGPDALRVELGRRLFSDPSLSGSGQLACESCHNRRLGWGDGLPVSFGDSRKTGKRNAPSLFSAGYKKALFWDQRAKSLEVQARGPILSPVEMNNHSVDQMVARVAADPVYRKGFERLEKNGGPDAEAVFSALAAFQRTLERPTRLDRFINGRHDALDPEQVWGLHLFRTKARCANCHNGPLLSDGKAHNIGLSFYGGRLSDLGVHEVTGERADAGAFATPSLRHVGRTGPYMHNGLFPSLSGVLRLYQIGGGRTVSGDAPADDPLARAAREKSPLIQPFHLTGEERRALVRFLEAL